MPEDESICFELDCCPETVNVRDIPTSEPLLIEAVVIDNVVLTESNLPLFS